MNHFSAKAITFLENFSVLFNAISAAFLRELNCV